MTDCLIAGENRAGLLLISGSLPLPARFFPALRRAALPPGQPLALFPPRCTRLSGNRGLGGAPSTLPSALYLHVALRFCPHFLDRLSGSRREPCRVSSYSKLPTAPGTFLSYIPSCGTALWVAPPSILYLRRKAEQRAALRPTYKHKKAGGAICFSCSVSLSAATSRIIDNVLY